MLGKIILGILFLLLVTIPIIVFIFWSKGSKWTCDTETNTCKSDKNGKYKSLKKCKTECSSSPPHPQPGSNEPKYPIKASTTNFASDLTSCACQQDVMNEEFEKMGKVNGVLWTGAATPEWMQSPYNGPLSSGGEPRNCSVGWGGCGNCFELTTTNDPNDAGTRASAGSKLGVIITDNCEASNSANEEWCIPYKNGSRVKTTSDSWKLLDNKTYKLALPECQGTAFETGKCTNKAGYGYHFDVQLQPSENYTRKDIKQLGWDNPIVTAKRVKCPDKVFSSMKKSCGKTGCDTAVSRGYGGACTGFKCPYFCSFKDDGVHSNMPFWGGCPESCPAEKGWFGTATGKYPPGQFVKAWGGKGCATGKKCCPGTECDRDGDCKPIP
jgi:hypothetical protein